MYVRFLERWKNKKNLKNVVFNILNVFGLKEKIIDYFGILLFKRC